jgi:hypothetical protein
MIVSQDPQEHSGKTVDCIVSDSGSGDLVMANRIKICFTDGSTILLMVDWRGEYACISQWDGITEKPQQRTLDQGLTSESIEESRKSWAKALAEFNAKAGRTDFQKTQDYIAAVRADVSER